MAEKTVFLTEEGLKKLEEELQYLETEKRAEVAARIQAAKEEGDISENAEYDDAKHEQAFVEGRIMTLRAMIRNAQIIEDNGPSDVVRLGSRVTVLEEGLDEPDVYHIVGSAEVDPLNGRVSNESPIGRALLGQRVGKVVSYQAPAGEIRLTILGIE
ncbi:MAG: transcription elongation factor GreA [Anaerolineae bacterium]